MKKNNPTSKRGIDVSAMSDNEILEILKANNAIHNRFIETPDEEKANDKYCEFYDKIFALATTKGLTYRQCYDEVMSGEYQKDNIKEEI